MAEEFKNARGFDRKLKRWLNDFKAEHQEPPLQKRKKAGQLQLLASGDKYLGDSADTKKSG